MYPLAPFDAVFCCLRPCVFHGFPFYPASHTLSNKYLLWCYLFVIHPHMGYTREQWKQLRLNRRSRGECVQCGTKSSLYRCQSCYGKRSPQRYDPTKRRERYLAARKINQP